jgi:hypothetical protein
MAVEQYLDRFQKMRKERVAFMIKELVKRGGKAEMNEFMGSIATNYGIRRTTQQECARASSSITQTPGVLTQQ